MTMSPNASLNHSTDRLVNCPARRQRRKDTVFSVKSNLTLSTTRVSMPLSPPLHNIKGTLEMQKMALQELAK
jgi:hypothetical protein